MQRLHLHIKQGAIVFILSFIIIATCAAATPAPAQTNSNKAVIPLDAVTKHTLENGMTVIVKADPSAPVAAVNVWVKTGYFNEPDETTGISHLLEHLFFKGTPTRPVGKIQDEVKSVGGYWNAGTIYDNTNYYITVPSGEISRAMDIEADALLNSLFDQAEIEKEREVVIQEIMRKYDSPSALAWEKMIAMSFKTHRLGRWRMGTPEQVRAMDRDEVVSYYNNRYRPENIVLSIAGDVNAASVIADAERLFGAMPKGELVPSSSAPEPEQTSLRYDRKTADITQAYIEIGFHAPAVLDADECAVQILSSILGSGKSSRLFREIKERAGLVNTIGSGYYSLPGVGVIYIEAELDPNNFLKAEEAIFAQLERIRTQPPTAAELDKIKTGIEYSFISSMEDVGQQASQLAYYEALGSYKLLDDYLDRLRAVTPEDVRRAAEKYFSVDKASILEYAPEASAASLPNMDETTLRASLAAAVEKARSAAAVDVSQPGNAAAVKPAPPSKSATTAAATSAPGGPALHTLSNGIQVITYERPRLPIASIAVYFPGGRMSETPETAGLTRLMLRTTLKGTTARNAERIQDETEALGTSIGVAANPDYSSFYFSALGKNLRPAIDVLADVILHPTFPENEIAKERETQIAQIRRTKDSMYAYPFELARAAAYGPHPYGLPPGGYEENLPGLGRAQLLDSYNSLVRPGGAVIAVTGDIDAGEILALLEEQFGSMKEPAQPAASASAPAFASGSNIIDRKKSQTAQAFAFSGPAANSDMLAPLTILRNIASGMGGRLYDIVREKNNLAYTVAAFLELNKTGGLVLNYAATNPENEEKARDMMLSEWRKMANGDISQAEFDSAKTYTIGSYRIGLQANDGIRDQLAHNLLMGRALGFYGGYPAMIESATLEQVKAAAATVVPPEGFALGEVRAVQAETIGDK